MQPACSLAGRRLMAERVVVDVGGRSQVVAPAAAAGDLLPDLVGCVVAGCLIVTRRPGLKCHTLLV